MKPTTRLRQLLRDPGIIVAPGAYDCLTASLIRRAGFPAIYMTGGGTSVSRIGRPDFGLTSMTEMVRNAASIAATVEVPVIADADTGYGGILNLHRTVREYEKAGVAAIDIEDLDLPRPAGRLGQKAVIGAEEMALRVQAAVEARTDEELVIIARTNALAIEGMEAALDRCEKYLEAGADVLFVEGLRTTEEAEHVARAVTAPLVYNFIESGRTPLIPASELERLGFKIVIFPGSAMLTVRKVVGRVMREISEKGTTEALVGDMVSPVEFFETMGLSEMLDLDKRFGAMGSWATGPIERPSKRG